MMHSAYFDRLVVAGASVGCRIYRTGNGWFIAITQGERFEFSKLVALRRFLDLKFGVRV